MNHEQEFSIAFESQRKSMEADHNRPRVEYDKDLLYYAMYDKPNYDRVIPRLMLSALLDLRDQNEHIIALLEDGAISDEVRQQKMRIAALQALAETMNRAAPKIMTDKELEAEIEIRKFWKGDRSA